jgi:hypothetical protein
MSSGLEGWRQALPDLYTGIFNNREQAMMQRLSLLVLMIAALGALPARGESPETVLDNLLRARAVSDPAAFLGQLAPDAVVLGMHGSGALSGPALQDSIATLFADGAAAGYRRVHRDIRYSAAGDTAWFNESLESPAGGRAWGSGVLVRTGAGWKVAQYSTGPAQLSPTAGSAPVPAPADMAAPAGPVQAAGEPTATDSPANSDTAAAEPAKKRECRRMRHKTNRASSC